MFWTFSHYSESLTDFSSISSSEAFPLEPSLLVSFLLYVSRCFLSSRTLKLEMLAFYWLWNRVLLFITVTNFILTRMNSTNNRGCLKELQRVRFITLLLQEHFLLELISCGRGKARLKWAMGFGIYRWGHFPWGHPRTIIVCFECSRLCLSSPKDLVKLSVILARFMLVEWYNTCIVIFIYICDDDYTSFIKLI